MTQENGILPRSNSEIRVWNPGDDVTSYKLVLPGDFVISLRSFQGGIELSKVRGIVSPAYVALRRKIKIFEDYYKYWLKSELFISVLSVYTTGIRQGKNISYDDFKEIPLLIPPLPEQWAIADFLDRETARIDVLIAKYQRLIDLLEEKRVSLISQAVTKGLDLSVEMKETGIPWLGKIPISWKISKIKYIKSKERNAFVDGPFGSNLKSIHFEPSGEVYVIESEFATTGIFEVEELKKILKTHFETIKRSETKANDIIIAKIGARFGLNSILPDIGGLAVVSGNSLKFNCGYYKLRNQVHPL